MKEEDAERLLKAAFQSLDAATNSGSITRHALLRACGPDGPAGFKRLCLDHPQLKALLKPRTFTKAFSDLDIDSSNEISFREFYTAFAPSLIARADDSSAKANASVESSEKRSQPKPNPSRKGPRISIKQLQRDLDDARRLAKEHKEAATEARAALQAKEDECERLRSRLGKQKRDSSGKVRQMRYAAETASHRVDELEHEVATLRPLQKRCSSLERELEFLRVEFITLLKSVRDRLGLGDAVSQAVGDRPAVDLDAERKRKDADVAQGPTWNFSTQTELRPRIRGGVMASHLR